MNIRIIDQAALSDLVHTKWIREMRVPLIPLVIVMGGDRILCCDEAVVVEVEGEIVGAATIAPKGEDYSGIPAIVGVYVLPKCRGRGLSKSLLGATIRRAIERGFQKIHIDVMSSKLMRVINALPTELKAVLEIFDQTTTIMDIEEG